MKSCKTCKKALEKSFYLIGALPVVALLLAGVISIPRANMPDFKIESDIPIPEAPEDESFEVEDTVLHLEDTRWTPFKPNQRKCRPGKHSPEVGRCNLCGDVFPCPSGNCGHFDCADPSLLGFDCPGNGTELPEEFSCGESDSFMVRATDGTISIGAGEFEASTATFSTPSESDST